MEASIAQEAGKETSAAIPEETPVPESNLQVLLRRRPARGLLGGMRALPSGPWTADDPGIADAPFDADWRPIGRVGHVFTHFALDLAIVAAPAPAEMPDGEWWPLADLASAGLPTLFAKAAALAQEAAPGAD